MRVPLWSLGRRISETDFPELPLLSVYRDHGVVPREGREDNHNRAGENLNAYQRVLPGDLVLNKMKTWQGSLGVSSHVGIVSPAYFVFRLNSTLCHADYMHHVLRSPPYIALYGAASKGIRPQQWDLPWEAFRAITVDVPSLDQQRRIAGLLDDQVGLIDKATNLRRHQLVLIENKFQALLDLAVDEHRQHNRKLASILMVLRDGTHTPPPRVPEGVPLLTAKNVRENVLRFTPEDTHVTPQQADELDRSLKARAGDVLLSIKGTVGKTALVPAGTCRFTFERNLALFRVRPQLCSPEWLHLALRSRYVQDQIQLLTTFSAQPGIYLGALAQLQIPLPARDIQEQLVKSFNETSRDVLSAAELAARAMALQIERKQALITAAVMGQLDVTTARAVA
jgi:type I restriction enzyme, S subunit